MPKKLVFKIKPKAKPKFVELEETHKPYSQNPDAIKTRQYRKDNNIKQTGNKEYSKQYYEANKSKILEQQRVYESLNRNKINAGSRFRYYQKREQECRDRGKVYVKRGRKEDCVDYIGSSCTCGSTFNSRTGYVTHIKSRKHNRYINKKLDAGIQLEQVEIDTMIDEFDIYIKSRSAAESAGRPGLRPCGP